VHDFTPAVVGVEVEVIFMFTSSWAWKKVVDGDGPRGGGLYPKCPTNKPFEFFRTFIIAMRRDIRTWPANVLGLSESILSVPQVTRQFHVLPLSVTCPFVSFVPPSHRRLLVAFNTPRSSNPLHLHGTQPTLAHFMALKDRQPMCSLA